MELIRSQDNERLKAVMALAQEKKVRQARHQLLLDGWKLCKDALDNHCPVEQLWLTQEALEKEPELAQQLMDATAETYVIRDSAANKLSQLKTPQGVWAVVPIPKEPEPSWWTEGRRYLVLVDVQNPENVGACIRTAAALGYDGAVLTGECGDVWSPRAIRAAAGSSLVFPIAVYSDPGEALGRLRDSGVQLFATALDERATSLKEVIAPKRLALLIGNEGHGIGTQWLQMCDQTLYLPMPSGINSLNAHAAAAIFLWELNKQ